MYHQIYQYSSPVVSGTEAIILVPASQDYPPIVTVPASPTMDRDVPDETIFSIWSFKQGYWRNRATSACPGQTSPTMDQDVPDKTLYA